MFYTLGHPININITYSIDQDFEYLDFRLVGWRKVNLKARDASTSKNVVFFGLPQNKVREKVKVCVTHTINSFPIRVYFDLWYPFTRAPHPFSQMKIYWWKNV